ncbi:MAG: hypothetical protein AB7V43_06465 [Acidimicrobiia bacterium]
MPGDGEPDDLYVRARAALLDTTEALAPHLGCIVLVGAQAIYLHTGAADLAVAEFTTDADFSVEPALLSDEPLIGELLEEHGFTTREHPGGWRSASGIYVDIMVPEALAGRGTRGADLGTHGRRAARRALGLEGALIDREQRTIGALDPSDDRTVTMNVAGPGALIVAKAHKLWERTTHDDRIRDKDALDVYRLLQAIETADLATRLARLRDSQEAGEVTSAAIEHLQVMFGSPAGTGVALAVRATRSLVDPDELTAILVTLTNDLMAAL